MLPPEMDQAARGTARAGQGVQGLPVADCVLCAGPWGWGLCLGVPGRHQTVPEGGGQFTVSTLKTTMTKSQLS